jgi:hypothetical protein
MNTSDPSESPSSILPLTPSHSSFPPNEPNDNPTGSSGPGSQPNPVPCSSSIPSEQPSHSPSFSSAPSVATLGSITGSVTGDSDNNVVGNVDLATFLLLLMGGSGIVATTVTDSLGEHVLYDVPLSTYMILETKVNSYPADVSPHRWRLRFEPD